jgi:hypothetical protein
LALWCAAGAGSQPATAPAEPSAAERAANDRAAQKFMDKARRPDEAYNKHYQAAADRLKSRQAVTAPEKETPASQPAGQPGNR